MIILIPWIKIDQTRCIFICAETALFILTLVTVAAVVLSPVNWAQTKHNDH